MRIHRPSDCALLFAIPLTREDFFEESQPSSGKQYARAFRTQLSAFSDEVVWNRYESAVVDPALSAIECAEGHGVLTSARATAKLWRATVQQRKVVSLVAHWRGAGFAPEMVENLPGLVSDIKSATGLGGRVMSRALAAKSGEISDSASLANILNQSLRETPFLPEEKQDGAIWVANDSEQVLHRNFELVRQEFPHWQLPPAGMELAEATYAAAEMVGVFSDEFDGTLDLRMCHSVILGEAIKRFAPRCRVVMNQSPVRPLVQLPLYKEIIAMLERGNYEFADAVIALHKALMEKLR